MFLSVADSETINMRPTDTFVVLWRRYILKLHNYYVNKIIVFLRQVLYHIPFIVHIIFTVLLYELS